MTENDLRSLSKLIFTKRLVKLFPCEPKKIRLPDGTFVVNKKASAKKGTSDMVGYEVGSAIFYACENKTINDTLKKDQREFMNQVINDGGEAFVLKEIEVDKIVSLTNWRTKEKEIIEVSDYV
jgi:hypothetical protein